MNRRACLATFCAPLLHAAAGPKFRPLFDGKSLSDWIVDTPGLWSLENGVIIGKSPGLKYNDFLRTRKLYSNFILKAKFRMIDPTGKGNSGIQFRSKPMPDSHEVIGYQADMGQNYWGCLYDESRRKKVLAGPNDGHTLVNLSAWNDYVITAQGAHITLELNGKKTVDYTEADSTVETSGFIALQLHGGPPLEMHFKDLLIATL